MMGKMWGFDVNQLRIKILIKLSDCAVTRAKKIKDKNLEKVRNYYVKSGIKPEIVNYVIEILNDMPI